jgi:TonB family protein
MIKRYLDDTSLFDPPIDMRICFILSLLFHVLLLFVFQKSFNISWDTSEYRTYKVDMIRAAVEDLESEKIPEPGAVQIKKEQMSPDSEAATISLETKDKRYVSYARMIKEKIARNWEYPREARRKKMEGRVFLIFTLERSGELALIKIKNGSGFPVLDSEAKRAIFAASPFPSFPEQIPFKRLHIKAAFDYRLSKKKKTGTEVR